MKAEKTQTPVKKTIASAASVPAYFVKAFILYAAIVSLVFLIATTDYRLLPLLVMTLSIPIAAGGIYRSTVQKIRLLTIFTHKGPVAAIASGRLLYILFWTAYAVLSSFFMIIGFQFFTPGDWILFFAVVPVFYIAYRIFYHFLTREIRTYLVTSLSISASVFCTPFFMLGMYALFMHVLNIPFFHYESVASAITSHEESIGQFTKSALVKSVSEWAATYNGIREYAAGYAGQGDMSLSLAAGLFFAGYVIFFNAVNILTFCLLPFREFKRILLPLSPDPDFKITSHAVKKGCFYALMISAMLLSIASTFFYLEKRISEDSLFAARNADTRQKIIRYVERIDDIYVRPGTITQIEAYKMDLLHDLDASLLDLEAVIDRSFDDMGLRADDFLDWYYSLFAEYTRIAYMIGGSAEDHLAAMLTRHLNIDENISNIQTEIAIVLKRHNEIENRLQEVIGHLIEQNRIYPGDDDFEVARVHHMADLLNYDDFIGFDFRMLSTSAFSGGGLLTGGIIGKKIVEKIAKKTVFKAAARTIARFGGSKVAGKAGVGAAGAAAGAAAGSIIPGAGTVAGAVIGGIAGSIAGALMMDKTLLMAEEFYSRDLFKVEIMDAIEKTRMETKARIFGQEPGA